MSMTLDVYQELALRTAQKFTEPSEAVVYLALSLAGEAGELANKVKKRYWHEHDVSDEVLLEEAWDCAWHIMVLTATLGYKASDGAQANIAKLIRRYPNGFDPERSRRREDGNDG